MSKVLLIQQPSAASPTGRPTVIELFDDVAQAMPFVDEHNFKLTRIFEISGEYDLRTTFEMKAEFRKI